MILCNLCPRCCKTVRPSSVQERTDGFCRCGLLPIVSRAALHHWEEPCISGTRGAGTVFFAGCNMHCVYCQNYEISVQRQGTEISIPHLRSLYENLIRQGAHNIDLVTPTHFSHAVYESLRTPLSVPVVYNCGGYESVHTIRFLKKKIQIWLPDLKYGQEYCAVRYSQAPNYFDTACRAIEEMYRQTGPYELDSDGLMKKGVLIRHLILPGQWANTKNVIDYISDTFLPGQVMFSLMRQYIPMGCASQYPEINRTLTEDEYQQAKSYLESSSIEDGFIQQPGAADTSFIPVFDGTGL